MAKKGTKIDEFVDIIHNNRVVSAIRTCLSADINSTIEAMFAKLSATLIATLCADLEKFTTDLISEHTNSLSLRTTSLEDENRALSQRFDALETSATLNNLIIHGVAAPSTPAWSGKSDYTPAIIDLCVTTWKSRLLHLTSSLRILYLVRQTPASVHS